MKNSASKPKKPARGVIAVDGPAGAGKSSAARGLAKALGYRHVDTGAMYRAAAWAALRAGVDVESAAALARVVRRTAFDFAGGRVTVDGRDATDAIRDPAVALAASAVARQPAVRTLLVRRQRELGRGGRVVMEGRDIGTVVFPRASLKFFLDASPAERAARRWKELRAQGRSADRAAIENDIRERDHRDRTRAVSPLRAAADAVVVDTTGCSLARVNRILLEWVRRKTKRG